MPERVGWVEQGAYRASREIRIGWADVWVGFAGTPGVGRLSQRPARAYLNVCFQISSLADLCDHVHVQVIFKATQEARHTGEVVHPLQQAHFPLNFVHCALGRPLATDLHACMNDQRCRFGVARMRSLTLGSFLMATTSPPCNPRYTMPKEPRPIRGPRS